MGGMLLEKKKKKDFFHVADVLLFFSPIHRAHFQYLWFEFASFDSQEGKDGEKDGKRGGE